MNRYPGLPSCKFLMSKLSNKYRFPLVLLVLVLTATGCSSVSEPEKPAPTASKVPGKKPSKNTAQKAPPPVAKKPAPADNGSKTYAIDDAPAAFKAEPSQSSIKVDPLLVPSVAPSVTAPSVSAVPVAPTSTAPAVTATAGMQPAALAPAYTPFAIEDVAVPAGTSPAVLALVSEADRNRNRGDLDASVMVLERALGIDPRNPALTYKLAQLRVKQNKPQLAEELAGKAALLAGGDLDLKRKSWMLIAEARQMQQNIPGAKEAKAKADSFAGR